MFGFELDMELHLSSDCEMEFKLFGHLHNDGTNKEAEILLQ
jgi:hypothetical protein